LLHTHLTVALPRFDSHTYTQHRAIASGAVIYSNESKRVLVVRFKLPGSGQLHIAKATWLDDADPRANTIGALVCAEMRAYKLLQADGSRHPNVGELEAVVWTACEPASEAKREAAAALAVASDAPVSPAQVELQEQQQPAAPSSTIGTKGGSYVVLIQKFYGGRTLDGFILEQLGHAAATAPAAAGGRSKHHHNHHQQQKHSHRLTQGSLEFERMLLPLLEGVASAIAHAHQKVICSADCPLPPKPQLFIACRGQPSQKPGANPPPITTTHRG